jgi:protein kinase A
VRQECFSEEIAKTYVCEAALALEEIHKNGFLYRDLLLDSQGHIRLADFGLAKEATTTNSFLGSVSYVAP